MLREVNDSPEIVISEESEDMPQECWDFQSEVALVSCTVEHKVETSDEKCAICHELFGLAEVATLLLRC